MFDVEEVKYNINNTKGVVIMLKLKTIQILRYLNNHINEHSYAPSVREIAQGVNLKSPSTVHTHLQILKEKQFIDFKEGQPRTFHLTPKAVKWLSERN